MLMVLLFNYEKRCSHLWRTWIFFTQQTTAQKIRKKKCIIRHIIRVNGFLADCVSLLYLMWIVYLLVRGTMRLIFFVSRSKEIKHSSTVTFCYVTQKKKSKICLSNVVWKLYIEIYHKIPDMTRQSLTNVQYSYIYWNTRQLIKLYTTFNYFIQNHGMV